MSVNNGIISEPVSLPYDIQRALGVGEIDLGSLCRHSKVNKWAMFKPEKLNPIDNITLAQRKANYFGLTPMENAKARRTMFGYGGTDAQNVGDSGFTVNDIVAANQEWPYQKPTGGSTSPYRQTDFACDRARTYGIQGYRHQARSPIFGWTNLELFLADVQRIANADIVNNIYNIDPDPYAWKVDNILYDGTYYNSISGRLSANSASQFGGGGDDMIPVAWLLGGIETENWRLGIAVYVDGETKMHVFTSCYPLKYLAEATTIMNQGPVFPALGTNQFLCKKMIAALGSSAYKTFTAMPVLVKNCLQTVGHLDGGNQTLITFSGTNTKIYSVPSDSVAITITLRNESKPTVPGLTVVTDSNTTDGVFILGTYGTGQYAGQGGSSSSITPILGLGIFLTESHSFTGTKTLAYDVTYTYGLNGGQRTTLHISGKVNITNSNKVTVNGSEKTGVILSMAPSLSVQSFQRLTYQ